MIKIFYSLILFVLNWNSIAVLQYFNITYGKNRKLYINFMMILGVVNIVFWHILEH